MQVSILKSRAEGSVNAPPSKSMAHRLLICAALSEGESVIHGISQCEDVAATLDCIRVLGARWERKGETVRVCGIDARKIAPTDPLPCRESGSTLRFFLPITLLSGNPARLSGAASLMQRPMSVYADLCRERGLEYRVEGNSIDVRGPLPAGEYRVVGNVSSQFISGLLFALPLAKGDSVIRITPPVESRSYLNLTVDALHEFGVVAEWSDEHTLRIPGGQSYRAHETAVEGDYSNAAFLDALGMLGGSVEVTGLRADSLQGDRIYRHYFNLLCQGTPTIHIGDCPDLGPILFSIAAAKNGGIFNGTRRLRIKESDRAAAMADELKKFGTAVTVHEDTVVVYPVDFHAPDTCLQGHNDHRIIMALSVLLTLTGGSIEGAEAVDKSFPEFFQTVEKLGVEVRYDA
ncbi:MAG: 3-phosphoshikimate 1-carboxyvinyltransferase [Ruminococcaceae bacterium]|nr:3-phosphoshikimate 1-carboxyvinyltransferase [Oscillospiraceae bacterium]